MAEYKTSNSRLAKNTIFLYLRMIFIMAVTLYTSRVILQVLGIEDYGIYNVVAGLVAMFGFFNSAMSGTTQRYISYYLGKDQPSDLSTVFSTCFLTHALLALIVFVLIESIGLWFLYNYLVIPPERTQAAFWAFQCATLSAVVMIISIPFNANIIAHEKMSAFAYISIVEASLKLAIVFLLVLGDADRLIMYGVLLLAVQCLIFLTYLLYCTHHFPETPLRLAYDKKLFREVSAFAGWNLWGNLSSVLSSHGLNLLLNSFFGPTVNAARGIAYQVDGAIRMFASNFQMAMNPQIVKTYATHQTDEMHKLVYLSSKFSYFLLLIISLPIFIETHAILEVWLDIVPPWTVSFLRLMMIVVIIDSVANPLMTSAAATGRVKVYQSVVGGILLMVLPLAYIALKIVDNPNIVFVAHICICFIASIVRFILVRRLINLSATRYLTQVVARCLIVTLIASILPLLLHLHLTPSLWTSVLIVIIAILSALCTTYALGLTREERTFVNSKVKQLLHHKTTC